MFEKITIYQDEKIDIGLLLEAMIFYQNVTVVCDREHHLSQLIHAFDFDELHELLDRRILRIHYTEELNAVHTHRLPNGYAIHDSVRISSPQHKFQDKIRKVCIEKTGKEGKGKRVAMRLSRLIEEFKFETSINDASRELFTSETTKSAVPKILQYWIPELSELSDVFFEPKQTEKGILVNTNIDFDKVNKLYHRRVPKSHSSISPAYILAILQSAEVSLYFASRNTSEIACSPITSEILKLRLIHLYNACSRSESSRNDFQDLVFDDHLTIRESYNQGQVQAKEIIRVILKADKFKSWLQNQDVDCNLIKSYQREVTKESKLDQLPSKATRWSIMTGAGVLADLAITGGFGTATGITLSAMDAFLFDKFAKKWKPNQFVDRHLSNLLKNP